MILVDNILQKRQAEHRPIRVGMVGAGYLGRGMALQILSNIQGTRVAAIAPTGGPVCEGITVAKRDLRAGDYLDGMGGFLSYGVIDNADARHRENLFPHGSVRRRLPRASRLQRSAPHLRRCGAFKGATDRSALARSRTSTSSVPDSL